jgi:hypothetical protein
MRRGSPLPAIALILLAMAPRSEAAAKKKTATPTATPTPTPLPLLKAAGSCLSWVPGRNLVLAEVGTAGRVFRIDSQTKLETKVRNGARLRVLYVEGPDGPVARRVLPGPIVATPTPGSESK